MNEPKTKNTLADLRNHLFATLEALQDRDSGMDVARARAICDVSGRIIDSAKVEVDYLKATGQDRSQFLQLPSDHANQVPRIDGPAAHNPFPTVVRHTLRG